MASTIFMILIAVMSMVLTVIIRTQPRVAERTAQIQAGRTMIERLTREIREGSEVVMATPSQFSFVTFVHQQQCGGPASASPTTPSIECRVTYVCTAGACSRTEALPNGSGPGMPVRMVDGLNTTNVFTYSPAASPRYVTVTLEYPSQQGGESITLSDGAALRNITSG